MMIILAESMGLWQQAGLAAVIMVGLGIGFALVLLIASIKLKVQVDPKIEQVYEALPKIDCGVCGSPSCLTFAEDVVIGEANLSDCIFTLPEKYKGLPKELLRALSKAVPKNNPKDQAFNSREARKRA